MDTGGGQPTHVFVGYDPREDVAYRVCRHSLERRSKVRVVPLMERALRARGLFTREWRVDAEGQYWDQGDARPFSSAFAFTRFLVPELCRLNGIAGKVVFCDCDFLWLRDPADLLADCKDDKAVWCVQHRYRRDGEGKKLDGALQQGYPRKLWSSLVVYDMGHPAMETALTPAQVNTWSGGRLHGFEWIDDQLIGDLPERWNWIPTLSPTKDDMAEWSKVGAIHYSEKAPWFEGQRDCLDAEHWWREYDHFTTYLNVNPSDLVRV